MRYLAIMIAFLDIMVDMIDMDPKYNSGLHTLPPAPKFRSGAESITVDHFGLAYSSSPTYLPTYILHTCTTCARHVDGIPCGIYMCIKYTHFVVTSFRLPTTVSTCLIFSRKRGLMLINPKVLVSRRSSRASFRCFPGGLSSILVEIVLVRTTFVFPPSIW